MRTVSNGKISMIFNLLENQNNIQPFTNKPISLFIDGKTCIFDNNNSGSVLKKGNYIIVELQIHHMVHLSLVVIFLLLAAMFTIKVIKQIILKL